MPNVALSWQQKSSSIPFPEIVLLSFTGLLADGYLLLAISLATFSQSNSTPKVINISSKNNQNFVLRVALSMPNIVF